MSGAAPALVDLTLIATHFHDFAWTKLWVRQIRATTDPAAIREILVIDQDRTEPSRRRLLAMDDGITVLQYPRSEPHFAVMGHDHPAVLNASVRAARGAFVCVFDSDAHPLDGTWLGRCAGLMRSFDAVLAAAANGPFTSHPCFMLYRRERSGVPLKFDAGLFTDGVDTGRLVAAQLRDAGQRVYLAEPAPAFGGQWGGIYLDSIYHHGQGSFHGGGPILRRQIRWENDFFRRKIVEERSYSLTRAQALRYRARAAVLTGIPRRLRTMLAGLGLARLGRKSLHEG